MLTWARPSLCCLSSLVDGFLYFVAPAGFEGPSVVCPEFAWNEDPLLVPGRGVRMGTRGLYLLPFLLFQRQCDVMLIRSGVNHLVAGVPLDVLAGANAGQLLHVGRTSEKESAPPARTCGDQCEQRAGGAGARVQLQTQAGPLEKPGRPYAVLGRVSGPSCGHRWEPGLAD